MRDSLSHSLTLSGCPRHVGRDYLPLVRVAMSREKRSFIFYGEMQIYTFLESSDIPETKNQCCHLNGKLFGPLFWISKWTPSNSWFDNRPISQTKQHSNAKTRDMLTIEWVR